MGSLAEAEEVVQDAWLRWVGVEDYVDSPPAHLTRIVTRLCPDDAAPRGRAGKPTWDPGCQILSWVPWSQTRRSPTTSRSR
ncbi:sigma factor [Bradyrhizobium sp. 23AC]